MSYDDQFDVLIEEVNQEIILDNVKKVLFKSNNKKINKNLKKILKNWVKK